MRGGTRPNAGRPKGTPNRVTQDTKAILKAFVEDRLTDTLADFQQLSPKEKFDVLIKLLPYLLPRMQSIELPSEFERFTDADLDKIISELKNNGHDATRKN